MPEKQRTRTTGGQVKAQRPTTQATLNHLFQRTNSAAAPAANEHDSHLDHTDPSLQAAGPHLPAQPSKSAKPSQLFPIFTRFSSVREGPRNTVTSVDDTEVIDITDMSSDVELSTEPPLSSTHQLSPHTESSQATSHSPPPSPIHVNNHYCSDTSFPHAGPHGHKHAHETSIKKESNKGLGDVVPLPSSCSQHVRGVQHSYTFCQAPLKRSVFPNLSPSDEGALDFLTNWRQLDDTPSTPLGRIHRSLTPQQCEEYVQSLGHDWIESHPAFAQISVHRQRVPLRHAEMWTRRFRPRRANEVLGNEQHALYLRDWLRALELHLRGRRPEEPVSNDKDKKARCTLKRVEPRGVKRPRVIRTVTRKRGNKKRRVDSDDDLDDFVVFSDADDKQDEDPPEDSEDELAFCQRTLTRLHRRSTTDTHKAHPVASNVPNTNTDHTTSPLHEPVQTDFADNLTNTLLITGPPGCGKTAAVYACAEELGWEIFEVYPGIGRRNGASLDHLVGDVGKNHIVQMTHTRAPTKTTKLETKEPKGLRGYLVKDKMGPGFGDSQEAGGEGKPIIVEGVGPTCGQQPLPPDQMVASEEAGISGMSHAESDGSIPIVRQSLVLLEEVDILFKEDAGFWPAVVEFIRCCQRPVVMTCNDPGLVPVADLPLQKVLVFEPCPSPVAATFLQCLSLTEGCLVPHEDLMVLYETTHAIDGLDIPDGLHYPRSEPVGLPDLRRSITQLQMLCAGARHGSVSEMHQGDEAEGHVRRSARPISAASRVAPMGSTMESGWWRKMKRHSELMSHVDAELCRTVGTVEGRSDDDETGYVVVEELACDEGDELIAEEAIRYSRGAHEEAGTGPMEASINPAREDIRARVEYQSRMACALQDVLGPPAPLMPQRSVFLDYIPWVRYMVAADDVLERRAAGTGRCTRNSMRTAHARSIVVRPGAGSVLRGGLGAVEGGSTG